MKMMERTRRHQQQATITRLRVERLTLKVSIQNRQQEAPVSVAASAAAETMGPERVELSPASAQVHRTELMSPTHATVLQHFMAARRRMIARGPGAPVDGAAVVQSAYEAFAAEVPEDASPDERAAFLQEAFAELRRLHRRWAKAEIAGVDPSLGRQPFRFGRNG